MDVEDEVYKLWQLKPRWFTPEYTAAYHHFWRLMDTYFHDKQEHEPLDWLE
jgi:hypothetical protein